MAHEREVQEGEREKLYAAFYTPPKNEWYDTLLHEKPENVFQGWVSVMDFQKVTFLKMPCLSTLEKHLG